MVGLYIQEAHDLVQQTKGHMGELGVSKIPCTMAGLTDVGANQMLEHGLVCSGRWPAERKEHV